MATGKKCFAGDASTMIYPWLNEHWLFFLQRLDQNRLAHAIMIQGPAGSGKNALASEMVAKLLCSDNEPKACGHCRSCKLLAGGAHPDRFELFPEEDSEVIKIDQVRTLIGRLNLTTSVSARKVAYIHPADCMTTAAANALLKSLEEPTGDAVLILVSSDTGRLPVTIRSRCQSITVKQPDRTETMEWLQQASGKPAEEVTTALEAAGGSPLQAAHYLESPDLDAYLQVKQGLVMLLSRPASVSLVSQKLSELNADDTWRWLSISASDAIRTLAKGACPDWLPAGTQLHIKSLLDLQKKADVNRRLSSTPVRGDLLLQDWLIRWAEQSI